MHEGAVSLPGSETKNDAADAATDFPIASVDQCALVTSEGHIRLACSTKSRFNQLYTRNMLAFFFYVSRLIKNTNMMTTQINKVHVVTHNTTISNRRNTLFL